MMIEGGGTEMPATQIETWYLSYSTVHTNLECKLHRLESLMLGLNTSTTLANQTLLVYMCYLVTQNFLFTDLPSPK